MIDALRSLKKQELAQSDYQTALRYTKLDSASTLLLNSADAKRLGYLHRAALLLAEQRAVPESLLRKALTEEEFRAYIASFDADISHTESGPDLDAMPVVLMRYHELVIEGDKFTKLAALHRKRSRKYDSNGRTASQRFAYKAESSYEAALIELVNVLDTEITRNPQVNPALAAQVQQWLDREVSVEPEHQPGLCAEEIPRVRGSTSIYTREPAPMVGVRKRRYWRDFTAVIDACLELIYVSESDSLGYCSEKLFRLINSDF